MPPTKILVFHNRYQQRGGEDEVFEHEVALLRRNGHSVVEYVEDNVGIGRQNSLKTGLESIWASQTVARLRRLLDAEKPNIAHFHNTFARISPAAYYACRQAGVPVVQTLHNFRIGCLNACCATEQGPCQRCVPHLVPLAGIVKGCYRGSRIASAAMAAITTTHKLLGTYRNQVDAFIALTEFARGIQVRAGLPEERVFVKPNFAQPVPAPPSRERRYAMFVGRLCPEKGLATLLEAWEKLRAPLPLRIVGDGPSSVLASQAASRIPGVEWLGARPHAEVMDLLQHAQFLAMPSLLYENFGLCLVEAFSAGVPCIVSGHGSMREIVDHERTGLHFQPGNSQDLAAKIQWLAEHPAERERMGQAAFESFTSRYTPERNYQLLLAIYKAAADHFRLARGSREKIALSHPYIPAETNGTAVPRN